MSHMPSGLLRYVTGVKYRYSGSRSDFVLLVSLLNTLSVTVPSLSPFPSSGQTPELAASAPSKQSAK